MIDFHRPTYDFCVWIGNFGVVPRLLLRAFLLFPILVFLLARRLRVTRVRETISTLLSKKNQQFSAVTKLKVLPQLNLVVKGIDLNPKFLIALLLFPLLQNSLIAQEKNRIPLILGKGEVKEITHSAMKKYVVGNKEVLRIKPRADSSALILKGVSIGSSDLIIWNQALQPTHYQIIVVSKRQQLKWAKWPALLSPLGVSAQYQSGGLNLQGYLKNYQTYLIFKKLFEKAHTHLTKKNDLPFWETHHLQLSKKLKKKIQEEVLYLALKSYRDDFDCSFRKIFLECSYYSNLPLPPQLKNQIEKKALIHWHPLHPNPQEQFKLKLILFQFENQNGQFIQLGLDRLEGELNHIFTQGPASFIKRNQLLLNQQKTTASTLAEPQLVVRPGERGSIYIGSEIPFKTQDSSPYWKFAGLKIEVKTISRGNKVALQYKTELTSPSSQGQVVGNRESSQVLITLGKPFKLFEIGYQTLGDHKSVIPLISNIPILGKLFTSSQKKQIYKKISAILTIEKIYD